MAKYDMTEIKSRLSCAEVLSMHGIEINHKRRCRCCFHDDNRPSMAVFDDHVHCYACGAHADLIDLISQLQGTDTTESIRIAAELAGIAPLSDTRDYAKRAETARMKAREHDAAKNALNDAYYKLLAEYERLEMNRDMLAPDNPTEPLHPLFVEAITRIDYVGYALQQCEWACLDAERAGA